MEDRLEKFILDNRNEFDSHEPPAGMWDKINQNRQQEEKVVELKPKPKQWKGILWKAASVVVIFAIGFALSEMRHQDTGQLAQQEEPQAEMQYPELIEAEVYYTSKVNKQLVKIDSYSATYPEMRQQVDYDISELDSLYQELKKDLNENIDNQEVIEAMIQNYRLKVQVLEDILLMLEQMENQSKTKSHEI